MSSKEVFVPASSSITTEIPSLGGGFNTALNFDQNSLDAAINFGVVEVNHGSTVQTGVFEISESNTSSANFSLSGSLKLKIAASFNLTSFESVMSQHALFTLQIYVVKHSRTIKDPVLKAGMMSLAANDKENFRNKYGNYFVESMDLGGTLNYFYRFATTDTTTKDKITASITAASFGNLSLDQELNSRQVTTSKQASSIITGGDATLVAFNTELGQSMATYQAWATSVGAEQPVRIRITRYQDQFDGFPDLSPDIDL